MFVPTAQAISHTRHAALPTLANPPAVGHAVQPASLRHHFVPALQERDGFQKSLEIVREKLGLGEASEEQLPALLLAFFKQTYASKEEGCLKLSLALHGLVCLGVSHRLSHAQLDEFAAVCDDERLDPFLFHGPYTAPDGTCIKQYLDFKDTGEISPDGGDRENTFGMALCIAPPGMTSQPVRHKTITESWFVVSGEGEHFKRGKDGDQIIPIRQGDHFVIPPGEHFQIRNTSTAPLKVALADVEKWPGPQEAIPVSGIWNVRSHIQDRDQKRLFSLITRGTFEALDSFLNTVDKRKLRTDEVGEELIKLLYTLSGKVSLKKLMRIPEIKPQEAFQELVARGYINTEGFVQQPFRNLMIGSKGNKEKALHQFTLSDQLSPHRKELFEAIESTLDYKIRAFASYALARIGETRITMKDFDFLPEGLDAGLFACLQQKGYLSSAGEVANEFKALKTYREIDILDEFERFRKPVFDRIRELQKKAHFSPQIYAKWSESLRPDAHAAVAAPNTFAETCDSDILALGTYRSGDSSSIGLAYAVKKNNDGQLTQPARRPLDEWYYVVDGVVGVVLANAETRTGTFITASAGESVFLPRDFQVQFASLDKKAPLKMLVVTSPAFESVMHAE